MKGILSLTLFLMFGYVEGVSISFKNITNIHRTKCKDTLIHDKDSVYLYAQISTTDNREKWLYILFETESRLGQTQSICSIHQHSTNCDFGPCVCQRSDRNIMDVFLNITAYKHLSGAKIKAMAVYPNGTIYHDEEQISEIYDPNQDEALFFVNGRLINKENCSESFNETKLEATFLSKTLPYLSIDLEIVNMNTGTKTTSVNNVAIVLNENERNNYEFTHKFCKLEEPIGRFTCSFQRGQPDTPDDIHEMECECNNLYFILFIIISVIINVSLIFWINRSTLNTIFQHICDKLSKRNMKNKMSLPDSVQGTPSETCRLSDQPYSFDKTREQKSDIEPYEDYKRRIPSNENADKLTSKEELGVDLR